MIRMPSKGELIKRTFPSFDLSLFFILINIAKITSPNCYWVIGIPSNTSQGVRGSASSVCQRRTMEWLYSSEDNMFRMPE